MTEENSNATTTIGSKACTTKKANRFNCNDVRQERINNKAHSTKLDPYLSRKSAVIIVIVIYCYTYYVYIARVCVPLVQQRSDAQGTFTQGVIYIVLYHVLFVWFCWSYIVITNTEPGYAIDVIPQSEPPPEDCDLVIVNPIPKALPQAAVGPRKNDAVGARTMEDDSLNPVEPSPVSTESPTPAHAITFPLRSLRGKTSTEKGVREEKLIRREESSTFTFDFPAPPDDYQVKSAREMDIEKGLDKLQRTPPQIPLLTIGYRYDSREGLIRPVRSHRCSRCKKVVLNQDHDCPWIGLCVGALNRKYFYNFLQASTTFTLFLFISLVIASTLTRGSTTFDGQQITIMIISGFFSIFTGALLAAHTRLLLLNMTTIEEMGMTRNLTRERHMLNREFGFWSWRQKRETRRRWNQEWGRWHKEMNLWYLGSRRENFESVMGKSKWGWFSNISAFMMNLVPIKASPIADDGFSYKSNPRFDSTGIMRRREEWPEELRCAVLKVTSL